MISGAYSFFFPFPTPNLLLVSSTTRNPFSSSSYDRPPALTYTAAFSPLKALTFSTLLCKPVLPQISSWLATSPTTPRAAF